jgi:CBS domain-containing protein
MNSAIERLLTLRVSDVMSRDVVILSAEQSMASAATLLSRKGISGAPVADDQGRCSGILSATDFVVRDAALAEKHLAGAAAAEGTAGGRRCEASCSAEAADGQRVARHMSTAVQTVEADRPLMTAARIMCADHVHRLPVVDKQNRLLGLITSLDIVAAVVNAIEE